MPMDWLTALATQDQSFEAQLAKRDLGKKIALLQDIAQQHEQRRQFGERQGLDERQLAAHIEENKARMAEAQATQAELARRAAIDDARLQVGQDLAAPAGTVIRDPQAVNRLRKAGVGDRLSPEIVGPQPEGATPGYVLDAQEAQRKADEAVFRAKQAAQTQKNEEARIGLAREANARAAREETQRNRERDQRVKANEARLKALQDKANEMLPEFRAAADAESNRILKQMEIDPSWLEGLRGLTTEQVEEQRLAKSAKIMNDYWQASEDEKRKRKGLPPAPKIQESDEARINRLTEEARKRLTGG